MDDLWGWFFFADIGDLHPVTIVGYMIVGGWVTIGWQRLRARRARSNPPIR